MKERLENFPVGYRINDFSLLLSIWEGKCPSPDRLPQILGCLFSIIELGIPVLFLCRKGDWVKVQLKMANDDCHFGLLYFEFC